MDTTIRIDKLTLEEFNSLRLPGMNSNDFMIMLMDHYKRSQLFEGLDFMDDIKELARHLLANSFENSRNFFHDHPHKLLFIANRRTLDRAMFIDLQMERDGLTLDSINDLETYAQSVLENIDESKYEK